MTKSVCAAESGLFVAAADVVVTVVVASHLKASTRQTAGLQKEKQ